MSVIADDRPEEKLAALLALVRLAKSRQHGTRSRVPPDPARLRQAYGDRGQDREVSEMKRLATPVRLVPAIKVSGNDG